MKKMRRLIPAIAMLLVSAVMLSTASFAWFTMSNTAKADGMTVTATASSTLLIAMENGINGFQNADGDVTFPALSTPKSLIPATHDAGQVKVTTGEGDDAVTTTVTSPSGLVTIADSSSVVAATGSYAGDYNVVDVEDDSSYYIDYTVYIGASGAAMTGKDLTVTVMLTEDLKYLLHNAVTIDFIVDQSTADNDDDEPAKNPTYVAPADATKVMNLKNVDAATTTIEGNTVNNALKFTLAENIDIPNALVATESQGVQFGDSIAVTMRVYFDGALTDGNNNYYVRNATAVLNAISFSVRFDVE